MLSFNQFMNEATIWDDRNHESGELFELKPTATKEVKKAFSAVEGSKFEKITAGEYSSYQNTGEIRIPENYQAEPNSIVFYFKDSSGKAYKVTAKPSLSNDNFIWATEGKSTNRYKLTELKELASLEMMLQAINGTTPPKNSDELAIAVRDKHGFEDAIKLWREVYYTSAVAHSKLVSKLPFNGNYEGERQGVGFTAPIYKLATKLTKKSPNNWNPSDVWFVRVDQKGMIDEMIEEIETSLKNNIPPDKVAYQLKDMMDVMLKDGTLIGVSLKQIVKGSGSQSLVTFDNVKKKITDMDFTITRSYIRNARKAEGLPAYGELNTKSGFNVKWGGRGNAQKATINYEGQMAKSTHQLGAIAPIKIKELAKKKKIVILQDSDFGTQNSNNLIKIAPNYLNYLKRADIKTYNKFVGGLDIHGLIDKYNWVQCKRFIANISVFQFMNSLSKDEIVDLFLLAKKVDNVNPNYYLLEKNEHMNDYILKESNTINIQEKSVSQAQQKLMGMAYALKKGDMDESEASDEVKKLAKSMSLKDLKDFASTKRKELPMKKEMKTEAVEIDARRKSFKQTMKRIEGYKAKKKAKMESTEYEDFFRAALKKFGVKSPDELEGDKEKKFYDYVDANWEAKNESVIEKVNKIVNEKRKQRAKCMNEVDEPNSKNEKDLVDLHRKNVKVVSDI